MRYVPTPPALPTSAPAGGLVPLTPVPLTPAVRRTVHDLRAAAAGRAWASRFGRGSAARPAFGSVSANGALPAAPAGGPTAAESLDPLAGDPLSEALAQFHQATTRYVCELRAGGARPEQMLVRVKAFVREAMAAEGWTDPEAVQALTAQAVTWSINAYYDR